MVFVVCLAVFGWTMTGNLYSGELELPEGPFPTVLLDEIAATGNGGGAEPLLNPFDYVGALNIKINQDNTQELQNEQQIVTNPLNPDNLCAVWRDFRLGYRRVGYAASFDGGINWTEGLLDEPTYPWHSDPGITVDADGNFFAVILSYTSTSQPNGLYVYKSSDGGLSWGDPVTVINGVSGVFEDKELIGCDRTDSPYRGNLYVTWARFGYGTDILVSRSTDGGQSFQAPINISSYSSHQWPVPVVGADGAVYIAWVNYSPLSIRFAKSTNGGASFGSDRSLTSVSFYPGNINGGIMTFPFPAMDADITGGPYNGNLYVAYMDYGSGSGTDIFFKRSTNDGTTWSPAIRINDDPQGVNRDQFHPWISIDEAGVISVIFLDRRDDPGNYYYNLYMTQSSDAGVTWSDNIRISDISSDPQAGSARAGLLGEYIGLTSSNGRVNPLWTDTRNGHQDAYTARIFTNPSVDLMAVPELRNLNPGDDLNYTINITNTTGEGIDLWGAGYVTLLNGDPLGYGPVDGPATPHLGPYISRELSIRHTLPGSLPLGRYYYTVRGGLSEEDVIDEDTFYFNVSNP
jgi:hypothetical protein